MSLQSVSTVVVERPERSTATTPWGRRAVAVLALVVTTVYLVWRALATVDLRVWWLSLPVIVLEAFGLVTLGLLVFTTWQPGAGEPAPPVTSAGDLPGTVAVLIPTCNEPVEVLLPTVAAAAAMDLPHETWVLDDGDRPWVRELADTLGVRYLARTDRSHAKAGNLNAALEVVDTDFVAVLDADHVPARTFLSHTLGHFADRGLALVQTPQDFYNEDSFEHVPARPRRGLRPGRRAFCEQALFYRVLQPARNRWNAAFWCGTNAVLRTSALREVGGLATDSITEDIHTTIRLHRAGWRTTYHDEVLARGLAASDSAQYLSQRVRWGTGAMQVLRREDPLLGRGLTLAQRLCYAATLLGWFEAWRTLAYLLLPVVVLLTGVSPVAGSGLRFAALFVPTLLLQQAALRVLGGGRTSLWSSLVFDLVRLPAGLLATVSGLSSRSIPFRVTAKGRQGATRSRSRVPLLHTVLLGLAGLALVWGAATLSGATPLHYGSPWAAVSAASWLGLDVALLVAAVARIRAPRFASERRAAVRVVVDVDAWLAGVPVRVVDLSVTGAQLDLAAGDPVALPPSLELLGAGTPVSMGFQVVQDVPVLRDGALQGRRLTVEFLPGQATARAALARLLFQPGTSAAPLPAGLAAPLPTGDVAPVRVGDVVPQQLAPRPVPAHPAQPAPPLSGLVAEQSLGAPA